MSIELKLSAIYKAAHVDIPAQASLLGKQGTAVSNATSTACGELSKLGHGLSNDIFNLGDEIVFRLRQVAGTMNQCSTALDEIADDFAAKDEEASSWMQKHGRWLDDNGYGGTPDRARLPEQPKEK